MKALFIITILIINCPEILNTKWIVNRVVSVHTKGQSVTEHLGISELISKELKGMQIIFTEDSMFMVQNNKTIDRGKIDSINSNVIALRMPNNKDITITYEIGANNGEMILTLQDGVKLYVNKLPD